MAFAQAMRNRLVLASGPVGANRLLWGGAAALVLAIIGAFGWLELSRLEPSGSNLQTAQKTQNGTGLSGVDDDAYRQSLIQKQEAEQAKQAPSPGTVSIASVESSYLDQQKARRDAVTESQARIRTQPNKATTTTPPPAAQVAVNSGMMAGYIVAMNAAMAAMTNEAGTAEDFKTADIEKWRVDALKAATQASDKENEADHERSMPRTPKNCLPLGGLRVMAHPVTGAKMDPDSPQTRAVVEMDTGPLAGQRLAGGVEKHGDSLTVTMDTLYYNGSDVPVHATLLSPLTQESAIASDVDRHIPARVGGPAIAGALQGLGQAAQLSGASIASGPFGGAASYSKFDPWQIGGMMASGAATGAQGVMHDLLPKGSTVTLSPQDPVEVLFNDKVCVPD